MACTWIDRDDIFEGYVRDALGPDDRAAFEEHFFGCEACFDKLETYRALQMELRAAAAEAPAARPVRSRPWRWVPVAAAAGLILAAASVLWFRGSRGPAPESVVATAPAPQTPAAIPTAPPQSVSSPAPVATLTTPPAAPSVPVAVLARVDPPIYLPLALRGPRDEAVERFAAAMSRYVDKDYAGAIPDLRAAAGLNPKAPHAAFFLGICQLLTDQVDPAVESLQKTVALGESPYLEEAHFYLAKARLRQGRLPDARDELTRTIERRGRLENEARQLLVQVNRLSGK